MIIIMVYYYSLWFLILTSYNVDCHYVNIY